MADDERGQSSNDTGPSASAIAPSAASDQVRANLGRRGPSSTSTSGGAPPYRAPFFARAAQPEICVSVQNQRVNREER
jgi:hypothetical protein